MSHIRPALLLCLAAGASASARADDAAPPKAPHTTRLSALDLAPAGQGFGRPAADSALPDPAHPGRKIAIAGQAFEHGVAVHAESVITLDLDGKGVAFRAVCGLDDDSAGTPGSVGFSVWADGKEVWKSKVMKAGDKGAAVDLPLKGVRRLVLCVDDGGDGPRSDHGDWAGAEITHAGAAPKVVHNEPLVAPDKPLAAFGLELYYEDAADKDFAEAEALRMKKLLREIAPHLTLDIQVAKSTAPVRSRFQAEGAWHDVPNHRPRKPENQSLLITREDIGAAGWAGPGRGCLSRQRLQAKLDRGGDSADISLHEWMHTIQGLRINGRTIGWLHDNPAWGFPDPDRVDKAGDGVWRRWYRFLLRWK